MPIYLAHGFRWPRDGFSGIRVHAIIHNLEPVSTEYIQNPASREALLASLRSLFPAILTRLESSGQRIDFLEQYDPLDTSHGAVSQPYAFVCDRIAMIAGGDRAEDHLNDLFQTQAAQAAKEDREPSGPKSASAIDPPTHPPERSKSPPATRKVRAKTLPMSLEKPFNSPPDIRALSANIHEITTDRAIPPDAWDALAELRDALAKDEKIGWWVVYNGDPERGFDPSDDEETGEDSDNTETGESVEDGVKELRPKVSAPNMTEQPPPTRASRLSGEEKEVVVGPVKPTGLRTRGASTSTPAVKSPTGGRIPPPVPPPSKSSRTSRASQHMSPFPAQSPPGSRDKELPPAPGDRKQRMNAHVDPDPGRAILKEKDSLKKEGLRKKFFGKKSV